MTEEEYFRKNYPDSCYGDKPLSPYWDYFQDGVEFGERQSEKKIEELEQENAELKTKKIPQLERKIASIRGSHSVDAKKLNARTEQVERLKKENAELKHTTATLRQEKDNTNMHAKAMEVVAKTRNDQLTKAKELLNEFMKYEINEYDGSLEIHFEELKKQAEQFLNSEVEKC